MEPVKFRLNLYQCKAGHKWGFNSPNYLMPIKFSVIGEDYAVKAYCPYCLQKKINQLLADVPEAELVEEGY